MSHAHRTTSAVHQDAGPAPSKWKIMLLTRVVSSRYPFCCFLPGLTSYAVPRSPAKQITSGECLVSRPRPLISPTPLLMMSTSRPFHLSEKEEMERPHLGFVVLLLSACVWEEAPELGRRRRVRELCCRRLLFADLD